MSPKSKRLTAVWLCLSLSAGQIRAQTIPQLLEQCSLDVQKLGELKTILQDMYKSYAIINAGYTDIKNVAQGNFNLHKAFLDGLLSVSPYVDSYYKVAGIVNTGISIVSEYKSAARQWGADGHFTAAELNYIGQVYSVLFKRTVDAVDRLTMLITANQLRMSDGERLQAIDRVYADITGQLAGLRQFNTATAIQALQRANESNSINNVRSIYDIHH